jgi:hypothetical protein
MYGNKMWADLLLGIGYFDGGLMKIKKYTSEIS